MLSWKDYIEIKYGQQQTQGTAGTVDNQAADCPAWENMFQASFYEHDLSHEACAIQEFHRKTTTIAKHLPPPKTKACLSNVPGNSRTDSTDSTMV